MILHRLKPKGYKIRRIEPKFGKYTMLGHVQARKDQGGRATFRKMRSGVIKKDENDGLKNLRYKVLERTGEDLFARVLVSI